MENLYQGITEPKINEVYSVKETETPGVLSILCNVTGSDGITYDSDHGYSETDPFGLGPVFKQWFEDNPDVPIEPYTPPDPPTPEEIRQHMPPLTARQFRLGLVEAGISPSTVTTTIAAMPAGPDRDKAQIEWEYATTFNRMHPLIATVGAALGLSDVQIDAMWLASVSL